MYLPSLVLNWEELGAQAAFDYGAEGWGGVWSWFNVFCAILEEEDVTQFLNLDPGAPDFNALHVPTRFVSSCVNTL